MCQPGALGSQLERLTVSSGDGSGGNGDVICMVRLTGGVEFGISGQLGVATSGV